MRNPGLEQATRVAVRSHAPASVIDARAGDSIPPPARGRYCGACCTAPAFESMRTPLIDDIDTARAQEYTLLSALLARAPDAALLERLGELRGDASPLGLAHAALAEAASRGNVERIEREYFDLFIGLGRGELLPYGSYYLTGFLHERPLARLRECLWRLAIERAAGQAEPEDHAAILCEIMAGLVGGGLSAPLGADRALFEAHPAPWMEKCI